MKLSKPITEPRLTRRTVLSSSVGAVAAMLAQTTVARQMQTHMPPGIPPRPKGSLVFLDYDQQELDAAYDQAAWAPNQAQVDKRNGQKSAAVVARLGRPRRLSYGQAEIEKLDLYTAKTRNAPINVWIHGGAWRAGNAAYAAYMAEMFVEAGAHFIALDFNNVIETKGNLLMLADQVRRAVAWVYENASSFGGDSNKLYLSGHSSGAHLTAVALTTNWEKSFGLPPSAVKGALCVSGMYDLYPVSLSTRASYLNLTPDIIQALSPQRHLENLGAPVIVAHGTLETPEFQRQAREFAAAIKTAGKPVTFIALEAFNHFEVLESFGNPYSLIGRAVLQQMKLSGA